MQLIKPSVEIITEPDLFKRIELAARTCYKSEDKIAPGSDMKLFKRLVASGHESTLEHSNIVVYFGNQTYAIDQILTDYECMTGLPHYIRRDDSCIMSGNLRAWRSLLKVYGNDLVLGSIFENHPAFADIRPVPAMRVNHDCQIITSSIPQILKREDAISDRHNIITARFICDRGVSHELVRHRCLSFSQESTRYVNYKEGAQFIEPWWWDSATHFDKETFRMDCRDAETAYARMMRTPYGTPQRARAVLNNALKTEVVATGTVEMWKKLVLPLRLSKAAHPDIRRIMTLFCEQLGWKELIECEPLS